MRKQDDIHLFTCRIRNDSNLVEELQAYFSECMNECYADNYVRDLIHVKIVQNVSGCETCSTYTWNEENCERATMGLRSTPALSFRTVRNAFVNRVMKFY